MRLRNFFKGSHLIPMTGKLCSFHKSPLHPHKDLKVSSLNVTEQPYAIVSTSFLQIQHNTISESLLCEFPSCGKAQGLWESPAALGP